MPPLTRPYYHKTASTLSCNYIRFPHIEYNRRRDNVRLPANYHNPAARASDFSRNFSRNAAKKTAPWRAARPAPPQRRRKHKRKRDFGDRMDSGGFQIGGRPFMAFRAAELPSRREINEVSRKISLTNTAGLWTISHCRCYLQDGKGFSRFVCKCCFIKMLQCVGPVWAMRLK